MEILIEHQPVLSALVGVSALLYLIIARRMSAFAALLVSALLTGIVAGLDPMSILQSVQNGMAGVLGFVAVIVGLGALLGVFLDIGGGAHAIAHGLTKGREGRAAIWAMGFVGIFIAIPVFFDVGLILLVPVVAALARRAKTSPLLFGLPLLSGLAAAHAFIPPTPGPIAVAEILGAELGWVIVFGLCAGIPAMLVAGPVYARIAEKSDLLGGRLADHDHNTVEDASGSPPQSAGLVWKAFATIVTPLILIVMGAIINLSSYKATAMGQGLIFLGHPFVALLIACLVAYYLLRPEGAEDQEKLRQGLEKAFEPTAAIILVTGAGGAFKQVLIDTDAGAAIANIALSSGVVPIMAAFLIAAVVRVMQGSATVAMLTAAGLMAPLVSAAGANSLELALLTVSVAAGATVLSHVNDSGFWLVSRYFNLSVPETLRTWTVSSTLVGVTGFLMVLLISFFV
jgi:Gnt-I system low-affinity gluconate transporter